MGRGTTNITISKNFIKKLFLNRILFYSLVIFVFIYLQQKLRLSIEGNNFCKKYEVDLKNTTTELVPKKKIVFVKTHKTGSTTLQSILSRLAKKRRMRVALPKKAKRFFALHHKPFKATLTDTKHPDMILHHLNFVYSEVAQLIPKNEQSIYITLLRDIPQVFESRVSYYRYKDLNTVFPQDLESMIENYDETFYKLRGRNSFDSQLRIVMGNWYFNQFHQKIKSSYKAVNVSERNADEVIDFMEGTFDLVLITEMFEESLILLKQMLGLSIEDISFIKLYGRHQSSKPKLSEKNEKDIREKLLADNKIYKHFKKILETKIEEYGTANMDREKQELVKINSGIYKTCVEDKVKLEEDYSSNDHQIFVPKNVPMEALILKKDSPICCKPFIWSEFEWIQEFKRIQNSNVTNFINE